jgi:hypothetical protein
MRERRVELTRSRGVLERTWPSALAGVVGVIVLVGLAFDAGGYFPPAYLAAGAVVFGTLAVIIIVRPPHYSFSTEALVGLIALTAFAIWTGVSTDWSPSPDAGLQALQRNFVYVGLFGLGLVAAGSGRLARPFVWGLGGVIVLVIGAGVLSRLYPHLLPSPGGALFSRLSYPLSYWNAVGALAAMGVALTAAIAADVRLRTVARAGSAAVGVMLATALYLTLSRGAFLALFVGAIVLIAVFPRRGSLLLSLLIVSIFSVVAILRLGHYHALVEPPRSGDGQASAGARYGPQLLLGMTLAGLAQAGIVAAQRSRRVATIAHRHARSVLACLAGLLIVAAGGAYALKHSAINGYVDRQWEAFRTPTPTLPRANTPSRLTTAQADRVEVWRVAVNAFRDHPVLGTGAGSYEARWFRDRRDELDVRNAHSLYLETLGELGMVGLLLLVVFVGSLVVAAIRARKRAGVLDAALQAGVVAALSIWLFHMGVDWDWQVTALSGLALLLAASLYARGRGAVRSKGATDAASSPVDQRAGEAPGSA